VLQIVDVDVDRNRSVPSATNHRLSRTSRGKSVVVLVIMVFPSTVATVVMPSAFVPVIAFIAVSIAIDWSRRVDHRRRLVNDRRWFDIHGTRNAQKNADVRVSESRARSTGSGNSHCEKKGSALHRILLSCPARFRRVPDNDERRRL
jgi:hypothetical protein